MSVCAHMYVFMCVKSVFVRCVLLCVKMFLLTDQLAFWKVLGEKTYPSPDSGKFSFFKSRNSFSKFGNF